MSRDKARFRFTSRSVWSGWTLELRKPKQNEPRHAKSNNVTVRPAKTRRSASDQSLRYALNGYLRTQVFFLRTTKTLIRLGGCLGWSESSLGAQSLCWFCHVAAQMTRAPKEDSYQPKHLPRRRSWSLVIHKAHRDDYDQTGRMSVYTFYRAPAEILLGALIIRMGETRLINFYHLLFITIWSILFLA